MKKVSLIILVSLLPILCFAQVKDKVCIVRPNYSESLINDIKDFNQLLKKLQVENPEEYIDNFINKGSSGSGFVYVAPDGKNYIITNRHVISDAKTSTVVFQNEEGDDDKIFSGLEIFAANADLDLAILSFPNDERPFSDGLHLSDSKIKDGTNVYTAGFPGLLGDPSWQFGSGIITNSNAKVPEMINPEYSKVIQHSAQIDAGNSGGPLLIKEDDDTYSVIGVNAWKITNRQDTNFSIPIKTVINFIENSLSGKDITFKTPEENILEKAKELQKVLNKFSVTDDEITPYISIEYIEQEGKAIFEYAYQNCNNDNHKYMRELLVDYSPIYAMRYAIGWYIFNEYHKSEVASSDSQKESVKILPEIPNPIKYEDSDIWYTSFYLNYTHSYGKNEWKYTNGNWELYAFKKVGKKNLTEPIIRKSKKKDKNVNISRENPNGNFFYNPNSISISYGINVCDFGKNYFNHILDVEIKVFDIFSVDFSGIFCINQNKHKIIYEDINSNMFNFYNLLVGGQLQFPITKTKFMIIPHFTLQGGIKIADWKNEKVIPICCSELGARFNIFFDTSNVNVFLDLGGQIIMDFKDYKPKYGLITSLGISI